MRRRLVGPLLFSASLTLLAQHVDIPLANWTVPPYRAVPAGGIHTMTDVTSPRAFIGMAPCRLLDTRNNLNPLGGGGPYAVNETRTYTLWGSCGIPTETDAVSLNVTATNTGGGPFGHIKLWPTGTAEPNVSTLNYPGAGATVANAAIVPLSGSGQLNVKSGNATADVIIDVNGYFSETIASPGSLQLYSNTPVDTILGNNSGGGYGVHGHTSTAGLNRAGVFGTQSAMPLLITNYSTYGVRGQGPNGGVGGISSFEAVGGSLVNTAGNAELAFGTLAFAGGTDPTCIGGGSCGGPWGVFAGGNIGAIGLKHFLDPHPSNPKLAIAYISLEGPEAGTYFRGRARFQNGMARIPVPEHFRMVTDLEGMTVQITPIGAMASFAVLRMDLNEIVVQASRNVEFSYLVQGVRATFKDAGPIRPFGDFMPRTADAKIPLWLSPAQARLLVQNGTYREDGSVNMETARRMGWDRVWEERSRPAPEPAPE